ncbi:hypothetical protein ACIA5A_30830 [Micromonospora sp. NPDC051300]|uniref:hypothetical protein n=1 Tax=Micromonospora sp. NPDC051300 TaxID=3364286 RepID=UPI003791AADC
MAVAQVLLRYNDERQVLRAAPARVGHLFTRLLAQSEYNQRLKQATTLMEAALRWLAEHTDASAGPAWPTPNCSANAGDTPAR